MVWLTTIGCGQQQASVNRETVADNDDDDDEEDDVRVAPCISEGVIESEC